MVFFDIFFFRSVKGMQQIATMPFTIMMENWRYRVFNGTITNDEWMDQFWEMKNEWVGVKAPAARSEEGKLRLIEKIIKYVLSRHFHSASLNGERSSTLVELQS